MKISDKKKRIKHGATYHTGKLGRKYRKTVGGSALKYHNVFRHTVWDRLTKRVGAILANMIQKLSSLPKPTTSEPELYNINRARSDSKIAGRGLLHPQVFYYN